MRHTHHSLKNDLTKTILLWSTSFFVLLGMVFLLTFNSLEHYILNIMADHRLDYQVLEFSKHLERQDNNSIRQNSQTLVQESMISAVLLVDASGKLLHVELSEHHQPQMSMTEAVDINSLDALVAADNNLHLFTRPIPGHKATLALVMDSRPVDVAIISGTAWTGLLMLLLILVSIKALHVCLRRQLVSPVEHLQQAIANNALDDDAIHQLEHKLPDEASNILAAYDKLKQSRDGLREQITDMMQSLSGCFWWSDDGLSYAGISTKWTNILNQDATSIQGSGLWSWTKAKAQAYGNNKQLQQAIERRDEKLDLAYQVQQDGQTYWYGEAITLCYDDDGNLDTIYGIINDISTRKNKQQEQAEQLEVVHRLETTGTLVGGIAHEFNNALAGMNGNIFLIKQSTDDEQTLIRIKRIENLIERSASMIDSMLSFARKSNIVASPISLVKFLNKLQLAVLPSMMLNTSFSLNIDESIDNNTSVILADKRRLQEMLLNLVDNANFAVADINMPHISMHLKKLEADDGLLQKHPGLASHHLLQLTIQDNGCGIPEHLKDRIFEPFFTTREVGQGTGLGLSMVYGYINQIGGAIEVESNTEQGSSFHIYLPRSTTALSKANSDSLLLGDGENILVVDDDKIFRESTCDVLKRMGYRTIEARNGTEAIQQFEQHHDVIRLILMDILMPGMTGVQTAKAIRRTSQDVPIIYLTAYDRSQPMEPEVYEEHAELINKPFRISTLSQMIQKTLKKTDKQFGLFSDHSDP